MIHVLTTTEQPEEIPLDQVNDRLRAGILTGDELAWQPGLDHWVPLSTIPGVVRAGSAPQAHLPPPPVPSPIPPASPQPVSPRAEPEAQAPIGLRGWYRRILAMVMLGGGIWLLATDYWFIWNSASATGSLTTPPRSHTVGSRSKHTEFYVDYTFQVEGKSYTGHDSIRHSPGSRSLPVYYERGNPADNKAELPDTGLAWGLFALGMGFCLYYFRPWKWMKKQA